MLEWPVGCTGTLEFTLADEAGDAITTGTATATLVDSAGNEVAGVIWPANVNHQGAGIWSLDFPAGVAVRHNRQYKLSLSYSTVGIAEVVEFDVQGKAKVGDYGS